MARKPAQVYNVHKVQDGSQIVTGVSLALARSEAARLNAEARVPLSRSAPDIPHTEPNRPTGMVNGEVSRYEVRTPEGIVVK